jgi:hypothetical protein
LQTTFTQHNKSKFILTIYQNKHIQNFKSPKKLKMKQIIFVIVILLINIAGIAQSGITWSTAMSIAANSYGNMHPRMTLDRSGNPMVIWGKMSDKSVQFARWNGAAFTTPIKLNPAWMTVASAGFMGPDIASKGDTVYVVVKREPEMADTNRILYSHRLTRVYHLTLRGNSHDCRQYVPLPYHHN